MKLCSDTDLQTSSVDVDVQGTHLSQCVDFQQCGMCDQQCLRSACANAQPDQSLCLSLEYPMSVRLLIQHHLRVLSLKGGCTGSSGSTLVKMTHCWKSRDTAHLKMFCIVRSFYDHSLKTPPGGFSICVIVSQRCSWQCF